MEMMQQQLAINLDQTRLPEQINFEEQTIIEQVLRLSLDVSNSKTFSKANGLPNRYVKLIKTMKMGRSKQQCTICIEGFCQQQSIKRFPCGHIFHSRCAKEWLKVNKRCPLCRLDLQKHFQQLEQTIFNKMGNS